MDPAVVTGSLVARVYQHRLRDVLTALPKLLAEKLFFGHTPGDEEIDLGRLKVITGSKYRQYCRARYGPNYLDIFAQRYLSNPPTEGGFFAGPKAVHFLRSLLG